MARTHLRPVVTATLLAAALLAAPAAGQTCLGASAPPAPANAANPTGGCANAAPGASCSAGCATGYNGTLTLPCTAAGWGSWAGTCRLESNVCTTVSPYCTACRFSLVRGTQTRTLCSACAPGYKVAPTGRACWCAKGHYLSNAATGLCSPCGAGNWCPGAGTTPGSAVRNACGPNMYTSTDKAESSRGPNGCLPLPGYVIGANGAAQQCPAGTYSAGGTQRACIQCGGGMVTLRPGANSSFDCVAPPGYFFSRGKAQACAQGFYKADFGNRECDKCKDGWTTAPGQVAQTAASACRFVMPGFNASAKGLTPGADNLAACGPGTFRAGTFAYDAAAGVPCTPCAAGSTTDPSKEGATSVSACLMAPGWGLPAGGTPVQCQKGWYNPGWNRDPCKPCDPLGGTITTNTTGADSDDDCFLPPGHGSRQEGPTLTGSLCDKDTYGLATPLYGTKTPAPCNKCFEGASTRGQTGATNNTACVTDPGYGYHDGQVEECEDGSWAAGGDLSACTPCGEGYSTVAPGSNGPTRDAVSGATSAAQCAVGPGYTLLNAGDTTKGVRPCFAGSYKDLIGNAPCSACPAGTTTTLLAGAKSIADCNACRPGYGIAEGAALDPQNPSCGACASGTYSQGGKAGGQTCVACPKQELFTGTMVTRAAATSSDDCLGEFVTDGDKPSYLTYDVIPMAASALTGQPNVTTAAACQAACAGDGRCQYYVFYAGGTPTANTSRCALRLAAAPLGRLANFNPESSTNVALFEVKEATYAVYPALSDEDAHAIGAATLFTGTWALAKPFCDRTSSCVGLVVGDTPNSWRAFSGGRWDGAVAKVRAVGAALNSWAA